MENVLPDSLSVSITITNTGPVKDEARSCDEVVQFYLGDLEASVPVPIHQLVGFKRVSLKPGQSKRVKFTITQDMMMLFDDDGKPKLERGQFRLTVGGCSPSARGLALGAAQPQSAIFVVK